MKRLALAFALTLALAQALAAARVELTFDEAYYALWARFPQAGYYDHPPMVAWLIAGSQALLGGGEFAVRAPFWAMGATLPGLVYLLGRRLYDGGTGAKAALLLTGAPLMAGGALATPDMPLVFFWTLALLALAEVWRGHGAAWAGVGLAAGLAGLAKMTAGFLGFGVALALLATPSLRLEARKPGPWLAAALALLVVSPFLLWNAAHGYATFFKQGGRLAARGFTPRYFGEFLGAQLLLFNPLTAGAAAFAARRGGRLREPDRLLLASLAPALVYFALHALHDRVQGNWLAPLYPALALLAARVLRGTRLPAACAGLGLAASLAALGHVATGWPAFGPADPALRIGGWRDLSARAFAAAPGASCIWADGYAATSLLTFYGPPGAQVVELGEPERWTFRPAPSCESPALAFVRPTSAEALRARFPAAARVAVLRREVGGVALEGWEVWRVSP